MTRVALLLAAVAATGLGSCRGRDEAAAAPAGAAASDRSAARPTGPVLVELFTSQGCSSCPPADRLLGQLPSAVDGVEVLPLAFHVDYWDDLGWRDPFSSAEWTARQRRYSGEVAGGRVYTPQLVVQGAADVLGSDRDDAVEAIRAAARSARGGRIEARASGSDRLTVAVEAQLDGAARADALVALVENGLSTKVARGENSGRALANQFVVRRLVKAFALEGAGVRRGEVHLDVDPAWRRDRLAVTVFLQDTSTMRVLAAASARR
jgi:hypothetical protein